MALMTGRRSGERLLRLVGTVAVALSIIGIFYLARHALRVDLSRLDPPYFVRAYCILAGANFVLCVAASIVGIQLWRRGKGYVLPFVVIEMLVLLALVIPAAMWLHPRWGHSIAAASGISAGLVFHHLTLFPLWGSALAVVAARRSRSRGAVSV
jgi:hypothetical protein